MGYRVDKEEVMIPGGIESVSEDEGAGEEDRVMRGIQSVGG